MIRNSKACMISITEIKFKNDYNVYQPLYIRSILYENKSFNHIF